jgi:hypothetical protein
MTEGEYRVGISFNPSANKTVDDLKAKAAAFIDACIAIEQPARATGNTEVAALADRAARDCEAAAMFAVKAATKQPR